MGNSALLNEPDTLAFPADGAVKHFRDVIMPAIDRGECWQWTLRLKSVPDQIIGSISLETNENYNRGFWIDIPWQRQGLMTEAVAVVTDYCSKR